MSRSKEWKKESSEIVGRFKPLTSSVFVSYYKHWMISQRKPVFCCGCKSRIVHPDYYEVERLTACHACISIIHGVRYRSVHNDPRLPCHKNTFQIVLPGASYSAFSEELKDKMAQTPSSEWWKKGLLQIERTRKTKVQICYLDFLKV